MGTSDKLTSQLSSVSVNELGSLNWYSVKRGETLSTVARKHGVARSDLAEANNLTTSSRLRAGQKVVIPREPATLLATRAERPAPAVGRVALDQRAGGCRERQRVGRFHCRSPSPLPASDLSRQARGHALLDRATVRHDGREAEEPQSAPR